MSRASEDTLGELHGLIARYLTDKIADGTATAADVSNAIKFLEKNGIDCVPSKNEDIQSLAEAMDFPVDVDDEDDPAVVPFIRR